MGSALLGGLFAAGVIHVDECAVIESMPAARAQLTRDHAGLVVTETPIAATSAVICVKPADVASACALVASTGATRVISILAGITLDRLESLLPPGVAVIRAMPNTPALLGASATAIAAGRDASEADMRWAARMMSAVGLVVTLPEKSLDAVTGLSGSGPAYIFLVAEALIEAGVLVGLDRQTSHSLVVQTMLGSARLLAESGQSPESLRAQVTSPGGTTAAGLHSLESAGVRVAFLDAVIAATQRSKELGAS